MARRRTVRRTVQATVNGDTQGASKSVRSSGKLAKGASPSAPKSAPARAERDLFTAVTYRTESQIGARIAELLVEQGRAQVDVARAVGVDPTAFNKILSGRRGLSGTELVLVARELSVDPQSIIALEETPVFAMRSEADDATVRRAMAECEALIDGYLRLEALVPQA